MIVSCALVVTMGCNKGNPDMIPDDNKSTDVDIPEYGYIFFDSEATRGTLYETTPEDKRLKAGFGVIGYTYSYNDWTSAEPQARPNVFDNYPQEVTWDGGFHQYTPMQAWQGKQLYAFFAYYPWGLKTSAETYEGNPYVEFEFPRGDLAAHVDVMTGHVIDADYTTRSVSFNMKHRLTALDVVANNHYPSDKIDEIQITAMTIKLDNILYDKVNIPLNMRDEARLDYSYGMAGNKHAEYNLLPSGTLNITNIPNTPLTTSAANTTMIIIPQNQFIDANNDNILEDYTITGSVNVAYNTVSNGTVNKIPAKDYSFTISKDLISGYRYYIQLNFADGDITIAILESDMWEDLRIKHDFE